MPLISAAALKGSATIYPAIWPAASAGTMSAGDISDSATSSAAGVPVVTIFNPFSRRRRWSTTLWIEYQ
jgi:hypothetical protein